MIYNYNISTKYFPKFWGMCKLFLEENPGDHYCTGAFL